MKTINETGKLKGYTIIHPADRSTSFLRALYPETGFIRITEVTSGKGVDKILNRATKVLLLGHGTEAGLLAPDKFGNPFGRYIISESHRYYLRNIHILI